LSFIEISNRDAHNVLLSYTVKKLQNASLATTV